MLRPRRALAAVVVALALGVVTVGSGDAKVAAAASPVSTSSIRAVNYSPGMPAIQPTRGTLSPSFTVADAARYVHARNPDATIQEIVFLPTRVLAERRHTSSLDFGRPDDYLICVVTLHGNFDISYPFMNKPMPAFHTSSLFFDAQTGNLFMESIGL